MRYLLLVTITVACYASYAQNVGIGTVSPASSAMLDVNSTSKGFLMPRMSTEQRNAIVSPATGLQIFNTDNQCINIYDGSNWIENCGLKVTGSTTDPVHTTPNSWVQKANFGGTARYGAVSFSIGNKGFVGTGMDGIEKKDFWEYDPLANSWAQKADFGGAARMSAAGFSISDKGYIATGYNTGSNVYYRDCWEYNPAANTWIQKADFGGAARDGAVGFNIENAGYVCTGYDGANRLKDLWQYNPTGNTWEQKADLTGFARVNAAGFGIGKKGYIGTGEINTNSTVKDFWEYDPATNGWALKPEFGGTPRSKAVGFSTINKGYIGTGLDASERSDFWEYNPSTNTWAQKADFGGTARSKAVGFSIANKGYIGTGANGSEYKNDFWEYLDNNVITTYSSHVINTTNANVVSDGAWAIQNNDIYTANNGNVGIGIAAPRAKLHVSNGGLIVDNNQSTHTQGAYLEWNKDFTTGKTYLLNQRGLGAGGIILGEVDNDNIVRNNFTLDYNGNLTILGSYFDFSDARMKTNITPLANPMDVLLLNGYNYHWKDTNKDSTLQTGVMAQELRKVFPNLVKENNKGELSVNYTGLIPILVEALKKQNEFLKAETEKLKAENDFFKLEIEKIKAELNRSEMTKNKQAL